MQSQTTKNTHSIAATGGLTVAWLLGDDPKTITTRDGAAKTIIELRDPSRLSQSMVIWLDGEAENLAAVPPGSVIHLQVMSARSGKARGELVATVSREAVEAAFARAGGQR